MVWDLAAAGLRLFSRLWGMRVAGLENVPREGPLLVAVNHVSVADPPLIGVAVEPARTAYFIGKAELFRKPVLGWLLRRLHSIPVERGKADFGAMRAVESHLKGGGCLVMFPEGTRSRTGAPGKAKPGVGFLARRTGAAVVPVRIEGTRRFPLLGRLAVTFGRPLRYDGPGDRGADQAFADRVLEEIFRLDSEETR